MKINTYADTYRRDRDNNFAAACYRDNSPTELRRALNGPADPTDCRTWGITEQEWHRAIEAALADLMAQQN